MFLLSDFLFEVCLVFSKVFALAFTGLKDELLAAQVEAHSAKAQLEVEVALNRRVRTAISDLSTLGRSSPWMSRRRTLEATCWSTSCAT